METNLTVQQVPVEQLKPAEYNPRKWSDKARQGLTASLDKHTKHKIQRGGNRRPQTFRQCTNCNIKFGPISHLKVKFCSKKCHYSYRSKIESPKKGKKYLHLQRARIGNCLICDKEYRAVGDYGNGKRIQKYCSKECFQKDWAERINHNIIRVGPGKDEKNHEWKGDDVLYSGIHRWVMNKLGQNNKCEHCGSIKKKKYEWANIDHKYRRVKEDWKRLCTSCHRKYDIATGIQGEAKAYRLLKQKSKVSIKKEVIL